jgi:hypothetical protein
MTVEVTVFQLDSGAIGCLGDEPDLGLAGFSRVGHDLPLRADVPTEDDPVWWIKGENTRPTTLTSVLAAVEDVAADERFETAARRALDAGDPTACRAKRRFVGAHHGGRRWAALALSLRNLYSSPRIFAPDAADLYGGDLLPDDRYESWLAEPHRRLRQRYLDLLRAGALWERLSDEDPTDEQAARALMRAHLDAGERREAIRCGNDTHALSADNLHYVNS